MRQGLRRAAVLVALGATFWSFVAAGAQPAPLSLAQYRDRLLAAEGTLRAAGAPTVTFASAIQVLGLPVEVVLPDGSTVEVTSASLVGPTDGSPSAQDVVGFAARLDTAAAAADRLAAATPPDATRIQAALTTAYAGLPEPRPSWPQRLRDLVDQALGWLSRQLASVRVPGLGTSFAWAVVVAAVAGVALVAGRMRRQTVGEARVDGARTGGAEIDWRRRAQVALDDDDLSTAVTALYHVLLGSLDARGVVREAPGLTAGECRQAVRRARPGLFERVDDATRAFERVAYGRVQADRRDVETLLEADRVVRQR